MDWLKLFVCVMLAIGALIAFCIVVFLCVLSVSYWGNAAVYAAAGIIIVSLLTVLLYSEL